MPETKAISCGGRPTLGQGPVDGLHDAEVAAPGAPDRLEVALVVLGLVVLDGSRGGGAHRSDLLAVRLLGLRRLALLQLEDQALQSLHASPPGRMGFEPLRAKGQTPGGTVDVHPQDAVELPLVRLLHHQASGHALEEILVDLLGHRIEEPGDEELGLDPLVHHDPVGFAHHPGDAAPRHEGERRVRRPPR